MARRIDVIAAFLACVSVASAVIAPFPHEKTTVYRYDTVITTSKSEDIVYSSQFVLRGTLEVTHDTTDPQLKNAYNVVLSNIATDMHNGKTISFGGRPGIQSLDNEAGAIQNPFLIIYNTNGTLHAVKFGENEPEWSKNMKMAIASTLQLDLPNIDIENLTKEPRTFVTQENTIHGDCAVTYKIHPKYRVNWNMTEAFRITKNFSPITCSRFAVHDFENVDIEQCKNNKQQRMASNSSRDFEVENNGDGVLIKKLQAFGSTSVVSLYGASYPRFVTTNTTFELLQVKDKTENPNSLGNFMDSPMIHDFSYGKPQRSYVPNSAVDVTQGRHVVNPDSLLSQLRKLLIEAFDYMDKDHMDQKEMDWNRAQTINKIMHTMSYMDTDALQKVYDDFTNSAHDVRSKRIKNILIEVASQVGTPASCNFTYNIIRQNHIPLMSAINLLAKLPVSVRVPTPELLAQMEGLAKFDTPIFPAVRKAGILSFASLIYRTFKYVPHPENNAMLGKYLHDFFEHVKNEPTYEMKILYLMAIKNVQVGKIYDLLEPIITGKLVLSEHPERLRLMAIWAIDEAVKEDYEAATRILLPVMMDESLPTKLRIPAYEILMNQVPDEKSALKIHRYVVEKGNEHFNNYHYTNLDSVAQSVNQCNTHTRKIVRSILETMKHPPESHKNINYPLSEVHSVNSLGGEYVDAEKIEVGVVLNEFTGQRDVIQVKRVVVNNDGAVNDFEIKVHVEGHQDFLKLLRPVGYYTPMTPIKIRELLENAAKRLPAMKELHIDIVAMRNGRVFMANHYNPEKIDRIYNGLTQLYVQLMGIDHQNVVYNRLSERQFTTDIGVPLIVANRDPLVNSLKVSWRPHDSSMAEFDLELELKTWKAGDFSMAVYNPMKDVWHAVRSFDATEMNLPFRTIITLDNRKPAIKFSFPESPIPILPLTTLASTAGILVRGRHFVTVDEEGTQALMESCKTCRHHESIIDASIIATTKNNEDTFEINGTGLKFSQLTDTCQYGYKAENYYPPSNETRWPYERQLPQWQDPMDSNIPNTWGDMAIQFLTEIRQKVRNHVFHKQLLGCGGILKLNPSTENPISQLKISVKAKCEDLEKNETNFEVLPAVKNKVDVTFETTASATNTSAGSLNFDYDTDLGRNHLSNENSLRITRKTPHEKDLKICIHIKENYPTAPADDLKIHGTNEESHTTVDMSYGYTDKEECVRDENVMTVTMKAELSDEQKMRLNVDKENSACSKDAKNPLYASSNNVVPRTKNCLDEAIRYTTLRKYTFDVSHEKLSPENAAWLYQSFIYRMKPKVTGNFKIKAEFPIETNSIDLYSKVYTSDFRKQTIPLKNLRHIGQGPVLNSLWDIPLSNSRFSLEYLEDYTDDRIRTCSVYPRIIDTGNYESIPFDVPSNSWTLVSGDHVNKEFAILVKQTRPNYLSFVVFIGEDKMHFYTRESDNVVVAKLDGVEMPVDKAFRLPLNDNSTWKVKASKLNDHFIVHARKLTLTLLVGPNYISIVFDDYLQGFLSGLCGHLNGDSRDGKPAVYSMQEIEGC